MSDRPRAKSPSRSKPREVSPPTERPSRGVDRQRSKPDDDEEKPKPTRTARFAPVDNEPNLEKRRIPSVSADQPDERAVPDTDSQKPAAKSPKPAVAEEPETETEAEPEKSAEAQEDAEVEPEPEAKQPVEEEPVKAHCSNPKYPIVFIDSDTFSVFGILFTWKKNLLEFSAR